MSYIKFEKSQVVNLEYSLAREYTGPTGQDLTPLQQLSVAIPENIMDCWFVLLMS